MPVSGSSHEGAFRPAAQYLRMSTEHQRYSLENQAAVISQFARANRFEIVCSYEDAGKSGVTTKGREGLKALLSDVLGAAVPFETVLVLDVSRWGRFQDPDEAAHYEFICKSAGVSIVYCAELFEPGPTGSILKQLKRIMAGEYSRQLSERVVHAKRSQARKGFVHGGPSPFGFARRVVRADGSDGYVLEPGEHKSRLDQNVRWDWGPSEEVAIVRKIFRLYTQNQLSAAAIAARLNATGQLRRGQPWARKYVLSVLGCELATGQMVFNKRQVRIDKRVRAIPKNEWERLRVCRPMVSRAQFNAARDIRMGKNTRQKTDDEMLADLRCLLQRHGRLSFEIVRKSPDCLSAYTYFRHFGSLTEVFCRLGYDPRANSPPRTKRRKPSRDEILSGLRTLFEENGRITVELVDADRRLPGRLHIKRVFGGFPQAYAEAGLPITHTLQLPRSANGLRRVPD